MKHKLLKSALCLFLLLPACNNQKEDPKTVTTPEKATPAIATESPKAPATETSPGTANVPESAAPKGNTVTGKVLETMDSGGYTYLQVDTGKAQQWVAIPQSSVKIGEEVAYHEGMVMPNFTSKSLNRTFDSIIFSAGLAGKGQGAPDPHSMSGTMKNGMANPHDQKPAADKGAGSFDSAVQSETPPASMQAKNESGGSLGAMAPFAEIKVEKAAGENGHTVAELFESNTKLDGKTVRVQGKVVKFSPNIMGKNWIHLQDGSGDPLKNSHDLVVTTSIQPPNDKEIITIEGIVRANKDFGAGYSYVVLVEEATIVQ
jgi:hypothetical protein